MNRVRGKDLEFYDEARSYFDFGFAGFFLVRSWEVRVLFSQTLLAPFFF